MIVGYSSGADYACLLAKRLNNHGIRVETMILVESTLGFAVPENVDYAVNYYESAGSTLFRHSAASQSQAAARTRNSTTSTSLSAPT